MLDVLLGAWVVMQQNWIDQFVALSKIGKFFSWPPSQIKDWNADFLLEGIALSLMVS